MTLSIVIPAKNEARNLEKLLPEIRAQYPDSEIVVVNDGSEDDTSEVCQRCGVTEVIHTYSMGNGAAIKSGARRATGEVVVFMDGDGQHKPGDIGRLLSRLDDGLDMVVGARAKSSHASVPRRLANGFYNWLASRITGHRILDLTSGFRAVRLSRFRKFLYLLPNGFSYPTTITMAFFRAGYLVDYVPIVAEKRGGKSHISVLRDGAKFLLIIFRIGTLYSPLKIFLPIGLSVCLTGVGYATYTLISAGRFTNMSALLLIAALLIFLIGLVSEQIAALVYKDTE